MLKKKWFFIRRINYCKHDAVYQTFVEPNSTLKYEILEWASSQTCIKVSVRVIIDAPEQETILCQMVW